VKPLAALLSFLRSNAIGRVALAVPVGAAAGLCVTAMTLIAELAHVAIYGIAFDEKLSAQAHVSISSALAALCGAGLLLGLFDLWRQRVGARAIVDPVEANALYGGRLSLRDGLLLAGMTLLSNGAGASVGLEAGYAQIGSALASRVGALLRLRRQDLRMLVGCGAAGAISAAFGAPLTGAFYAFELIIGAYTLATAAPVLAAAVAGRLTVHVLGGAPYSIEAPLVPAFGVLPYLALAGLGLVSAVLGVAAMRAAALVERAFHARALPGWARPVVGGALVAGLAALTPQTLGAGHGALALDLPRTLSAATLVKLIGLKLSAALISLASGFRGGLFFASLFVGALLGKLYALGVAAVAPGVGLDPTASALAGMATLGAAIVGGPLTMAFLVLESSGDVGLAGPVLAGCVASHLTVKAIFGYSFSTWRLHLRGEDISGAHDVGWVRALRVGELMDRQTPVLPAGETLAAFRLDFPPGGPAFVALIDDEGRYAGLVSTAQAHAEGEADETLARFGRIVSMTLLPDQNIQQALEAFAEAESEVLAVVDPQGRVVGTLREAYAARRYAAALELASAGVLGGA